MLKLQQTPLWLTTRRQFALHERFYGKCNAFGYGIASERRGGWVQKIGTVLTLVSQETEPAYAEMLGFRRKKQGRVRA